MWLGLLGPLLVREGTGELSAGSGKQRVVLAALGLQPGRAVSVGELSTLLWDTTPPPAAAVTVRNHVKRLRQALGPTAGTRVITRAPGYLLDVDPGEVDALAFGRLCEDGREAARDGDWRRAADLFGEALALWRGAPLADVPSDVLQRQRVPQLEQLRLQAVEQRVDAQLHLGRHADLIPELYALVAEHPLREAFHGQLMIALYGSGRQGEAQGVYQRARRMLVEELGVEPGPVLSGLHQRVLAGDPSLLPVPEAQAAGEAGPASPGGGRPPADRPQPLDDMVVPRQLPASVPHFAGRSAELELLRSLFDEGADSPGTVVISAIDGMPGVGKTTLAVQWAHQVASRFPDGQLYINLRGFGPSADPVSPADAIRRFLDALGVPADRVPSSADAQQDLYRSLLARRRMLILLDNARDAAQVRGLLPGGAGCVVLVTSRRQLTSLVAVEGARPLFLDVLTATEARELLARRLGQERVAADPSAATELIELCARLPLALAIAAARAAMHPGVPLTAVVTELRDAAGRLDALDAGEAVSVRAIFSWSYQDLPDSARRMFRLLGIHPGPDISAAAAGSLAGAGQAQARAALNLLTQANLLTADASGRFRFHDLVREYAVERADTEEDEPERHAAAHRALDHYLHTAHSAAMTLQPNRPALALDPPRPDVAPEPMADPERAMAWLEAEYRVLLAIEDLAVSAGADTHAWRLPLCLTGFTDRRGYWRDFLPVQETALAAAQRLGLREAQAMVHRSIGGSNILLESYQDADHHYEQAVGLYRQLGDMVGLARVLLGTGASHEHQGRYPEALEHCAQALALYQSLGDRAWQAITLNNIGWCHVRLGDYAQAVTSCRQAIELHEGLGEPHSEAHAWDTLGYAHHRLGQHAEAVSCYQQALTLFRQTGDPVNEAEILDHLGDAHQAAGRPALAREAWLRAAVILDGLKGRSGTPIRAKLQRSAEAAPDHAQAT
jgi:DNA-binding SARP family transcriptional activator/tetratricopeptide (TPR) repeat protein